MQYNQILVIYTTITIYIQNIFITTIIIIIITNTTIIIIAAIIIISITILILYQNSNYLLFTIDNFLLFYLLSFLLILFLSNRKLFQICFLYISTRPVHWTAYRRIFERSIHHGRPINRQGYPRVCSADPGMDPIFVLLYTVIFSLFQKYIFFPLVEQIPSKTHEI